MVSYVCVLAILSAVVVTYLLLHPISTDYSNLLALTSSVVFDDRNDSRLSNISLQISSQSVMKHQTLETLPYPSTDTVTRPALGHNATEARGIQASNTQDLEVIESRVPSAAHLIMSHNLKTHVNTNSGVCIKDNCLEYLSPAEISTIGMCKKKIITKKVSTKIEKGSCNFLSDRGRRAVALASPEGSGNTWLRGVLEKATGICTGFCCCDAEMRARGFVGEGIMSGKVLVVKTHIAFPQWIGQVKKLRWEGSYDSAIVLIRNPAKSVIAEWNRRMTNSLKRLKNRKGTNSSHINVIAQEVFSKFSCMYST